MKLNALILLLFLNLLSCNQAKKDKASSEGEANSTPQTSSKPILGIDVSHFQGDINWEEIKNAKIQFAYDKATQGKHFKDPDYFTNQKAAHTVGLLHGAYHFYISGDSPKEQAHNFLSALDYSSIDLPPVLDLEEGGIKAPIDITNFQADVLQWLKIVEDSLKVRPIIYTNNPFGNQYLDHPDFEKYDLWIAEYDVNKPKIPNAWEKKGWLIWQRSDRISIEGAIGKVDHDLFNPQKSFQEVFND